MEHEESNEDRQRPKKQVSTEEQVAINKILYKNIQTKTAIRFILNEDDEWRIGKVLFRAGKNSKGKD